MLFSDVEEYRQSAKWFSYHEHQLAYWHNFDVLTQANTPHDDTTLVFLHGFPSASWDWHAQWTELSKYYRCLAFDMLGFGLSDKPSKHQYSLIEQADIAKHLCSLLNVTKVHLIAHDYGVSVAQQLLYERSESSLALDIQSICFLNGGLFADVHRPLLTQRLLHSVFGPLVIKFINKDSLRKSFIKIFGEKTPPSAHEVDLLYELLEYKNGKRVLHRLLKYLDERVLYKNRWLKSMQDSKIPLAFINGLDDPVSGAHMLEEFQQRLPNSPTAALSVGHYPQLEAPEKVIVLLCQFLKDKRFS
jgi:pimeloyl-ACP methyl ester carboxylesterase